MQSGDCAHCWARWAGICRMLGGKFYISGVAGYNTPIWDVLALQGVREEAGGHQLQCQINQFLPD